MSILRVDEIRDNGAGFNDVVTFANSNGTENGKLVRASVNFNGQGTVAIRGSFNVNTMSDLGAGYYRVNFSNALSDANYSLVGTCQPANGTNNAAIFYAFTSGNGSTYTNVAPTTTAAEVVTSNGSGGAITDYNIVTIGVFR